MGSGASIPGDVTLDAVAVHVDSIAELSGYTNSLIENGLNGEILYKLEENNVEQTLDALQVTDTSHRDLFKGELSTFKDLFRIKSRREDMLELRMLNLSTKECLKVGFSIRELKSIDNWFSITDFVTAGCSAEDLFHAGYTFEDLTITGITIDQSLWKILFDSKKYTLQQFKNTNCPGVYLKEFGVKPLELLEAGYQSNQVYTVAEGKTKYGNYEIITKMGYSHDEIRSVFTIEELKDQNVPIHIIRNIGYTVGIDIKTEWKTKTDIVLSQPHSICTLLLLSNGLLATGCWDTIKLWDTKTGICTHSFTGYADYINSLIQLANNSLAIGSFDAIKIINPETGQCLSVLVGHSDYINALSELSNGMLVSASKDRSVRVWDVSTRECIKVITGNSSSVLSLAQVSNGLLACGYYDNTIKLWDITSTSSSCYCYATLSGHFDSVNLLIALPNNFLASGSYDGMTRIWDVNRAVCVNILEGFVNEEVQVFWEDDDEWFVGKVVQYHTTRGYKIKYTDGECEWLQSLNVDTVKLLSGKSKKTDKVMSLIRLYDGVFACGFANGTIKIWDSNSNSANVANSSLNSSGIYTSSGNSSSNLNSSGIYTSNGVVLSTLIGEHGGAVFALARLADGVLASGSADHTVKLWTEHWSAD